ncbi:hypothetical protein [Cupriavidus pampae]|uniref:Uncharacterized protein n=1 Tax=Cupriavidus pampae TaxID=659251 RepID=A0ABM8XTX1_9BURK|nr:hypothetical protein [Cupriavidus pampae]CAG9183808.1 hypothetical protein LMG32289_05427 [Cupriavidus pampae]
MSDSPLDLSAFELPIDGLQAVSVDGQRGELIIEYLVEIEMERRAIPARLRLSTSASAALVHAVTTMVETGQIQLEEASAPLIQ